MQCTCTLHCPWNKAKIVRGKSREKITLENMDAKKLLSCRICLVEDVRMHSIIDTHLQDVYEKLTKIPLESKHWRPLVVCYICYHRLQNCYQLRRDSLRSEEYLAQMLAGGELPELKVENIGSHYRLKISPAVHLAIGFESDENLDDNVKNEMLGEKYVEVKMEQTEAIPIPVIDDNNIGNNKEFDGNIQSSDPEDDIPLKIIKIDTERRIRRKRKKKQIVLLRSEDNEDSKAAINFDAREILLSKEEQMSNLLARSKSMNYTHSPYKCELCYKGFIDETAYDNHKIKHDKRSGSHSCEICHMRYRTSRQLKTHVVTAHSRLYKCNKCGHTTHTASQAKVHERWHSGFLYECQLCGHKFKKPTSYLTHMRKRHPTESVCEVCGECFVGQLGLQMHKSKTHNNDMQIENNDEPVVNRYCKECDIQFLSREAWNRHILCSSKHKLTSETSECNICGWRGDSTSVTNHMREHSRRLRQRRPIALHAASRVPCQCAQCGMKFVSRQNLQAHVNRTHRGIKYNKNIVCEICGKHCTSNATLKYHQRTHTGERPYTCSTCSKQFSDKNQLKLHTRTHTGEKPYECNICNKRFTQKPTLNRHYRIHTGDKPYTCQHCSRSFTQSNSLKMHVRTVHLKLPAFRNKNEDIKSEEKIQIVENVH